MWAINTTSLKMKLIKKLLIKFDIFYNEYITLYMRND